MSTKTVVFPVASSPVRYFVRVHRTTAVASGSVTLTMTLDDRNYPTHVASQGDVIEVPYWLPVSVSNAAPGAIIEFTIDDDPTVIGSGVADSSGGLIDYSVLLPATLTAGTHTLHISGGGVTASVEFTVSNAVAARPPAAPTDPGYTPAIINRWRLVDPAGVLVLLTFPINPAVMSSPHAARIYSAQHSTSPLGQPITFEGGAVAQAWNIEGTVKTEAFYRALEAYRNAQRRLIVVDHLNRAWIVAFDSLDFTPARDRHNDWSFQYKARFMIMSRAD